MERTRVVIYSCMPSTSSGFSYYALFIYKPKGARAQALVERIKRDHTFPRHIQARSTFEIYLRYSGLPWAERRAGSEVWSRYLAWARGQKLAA